MNLKKIIAIACGLVFYVISLEAANTGYEVIKHSHNDYHQSRPLFDALEQGFSSVEADVFLIGDSLFVAHDRNEIATGRTLRSLYLEPLKKRVQQNNGSVYGKGEELILFVDIKEDSLETYKKLHQVLSDYTDIISSFRKDTYSKKAIRVIVSGNRPVAYMKNQELRYAGFDGRLTDIDSGLSPDLMPMVSDDWNKYFTWRGIGEMPDDEKRKLESFSQKAKANGYLLRFWALPTQPVPEKDCWYQLIKSGVPVIGSDDLKGLKKYVGSISEVFEFKPQGTFKSTEKHKLFTVSPTSGTEVKNVILMVADGMGISHFSAAWIANKGQMNIDNCMYTGLARTFCANRLITDSGAAGTAMATGHKANYHAVGVDSQNVEHNSLTDLAHAKGLKTAIVVTCGLTDATPATFCANNPERDNEEELAADFLTCNVDFLFGGGRNKFHNRGDGRNILNEMEQNGYQVCSSWEQTGLVEEGKVLAILEEGQLPLAAKRGDLFSRATTKALEMVSSNENGFFAMFEGSRIDDCGHWNDMPRLVEEINDFDEVVGEVLEWAEKDGQTLVVILADHETGGLTIANGEIASGTVEGNFANREHSGILVPVYTYGPQSNQFTGIFDNTEIFAKIKSILDL